MTQKPSNKPKARIGTRIRGQMAAAYEARGETAGDLYLHFSSKMKMDVVLSGRLSYLHFLLVERDPGVDQVDYAPSGRLATLMGKEPAELVDAEIKTTAGEVVWRRLIDKEADDTEAVRDLREAIGKGALRGVNRLEVLTFKQLVAEDTWTRNTHRALAWIAAARSHPLSQPKQDILALLKTGRAVSFQDCLELGAGQAQALYGAAVLQMALNGAVQSDLGVAPLTARTRFTARREGH
ncbi:hypothetical protein [Roseateles asaccharophilus]|uniref:Uncharacterized protein n=1 Tax=Roseateles asaccharophilus TaxID=582607 RepID=A0ABU2ACK3_9BURK|nr:hypothetical protein [Roseateles asaccharophilus]MDR7334333.1 hypothetical protein [Roseateles asaccharophilus]